MKKLLSFCLILLLPLGTLHAIDWEKEMALEVGATFKNPTRAVYLECDMNTDIGSAPGVPRQHFKIRLLHDAHIKGSLYKKDTEVGGTGISYNPQARLVSIITFDIKPAYQNHGLGTDALHTLLGIYRSPKRTHLEFDYFDLEVSDHNEKAIRVYQDKCGFIAEPSSVPDFLNMTLPRVPQD